MKKILIVQVCYGIYFNRAIEFYLKVLADISNLFSILNLFDKFKEIWTLTNTHNLQSSIQFLRVTPCLYERNPLSLEQYEQVSVARGAILAIHPDLISLIVFFRLIYLLTLGISPLDLNRPTLMFYQSPNFARIANKSKVI